MFVAVAQQLSFTRAADQLGVTAGAASLQIKALEEYLGKPLLRRDRREVNLTADGERLLPRVLEALEVLEQALDDTRAPRSGGALRISLLASFLNRWLAPRIDDFHGRHPDVRLTFVTSNDVVDFVRSPHDAAIRMGRGNWPNVDSEKILDEWLVPVCTPALLRKHGLVDEPDRLRRYPLLHSVSEPWALWITKSNDNFEDYDPAGGVSVYEDSAAVLVAARRGVGLALARWSLVVDEVQQGGLVLATRKPLPNRLSYWFVHPKRNRLLPAVETFRNWLRDQAARTPRPQGSG